jgi:hypothetical protein
MTVHLYTNIDGTVVWLYICTLMLMVQLYDCTFVHCNVDATITVYTCSHTTVPSTLQCTNVQSYNCTINITVYKCSHTTVSSTLRCTNVVDGTFVHCNVDGTVVWLCNVDGTVVWLHLYTNVDGIVSTLQSHTTVPSTLQSYNCTINITVYKCTVIQLYHQHYNVHMYSHTTTINISVQM